MSLLFYLKRVTKAAIGILILVLLLQRSTYPTYFTWNAVALVVAEEKFDYVTWTAEALWSKLSYSIGGQHYYLSEAQASDIVRAYMADLAQAQQLEAELDRRYLDNPFDDTSALQSERDTLRRNLASQQTMVEAILEGQISAVLVDEGFGTLGQLLPPVAMRFTQMPNLLVVSPRDEIRRSVELAVRPMNLAERANVERRVQSVRDVSALVVPLGGMAIYPAMIQESANIAWVVDTFAHEWLHHYFFFFPLGLNYFVDVGGSPEALIINETVADMFGREIANITLARYYPELTPQVNQPPTAQFIADSDSAPFDYGATMHETRANVDNIMHRIANLRAVNNSYHRLSDAPSINKNEADIRALIDKAEGYMEHRRLIFVENGYRIRQLNQAYFAFYGGYQGGIPGIGGQDPIGPAVQDIRDLSPSLHDFVIIMRDITNRAQLIATRDDLASAQE